MISSLQPITSAKGISPNSVLPKTKSCAFVVHTLVPCERPDILTSWAKVFGNVSFNIRRTNVVPNSGTAKDATCESISSLVIFKISVSPNIL